MTEKAFNLFVYIEGENIRNLGVVAHDVHGDDQEMLVFLQSQVSADADRATRYPLPTASINAWLRIDAKQEFTFEMFEYLSRTGHVLHVFEHVLQDVCASLSPLVCITPIKDGKPRIDVLTHVDPTATNGKMLMEEFNETVLKIDYLGRYVSSKKFDLGDLLGDDFLSAIKILYEQKHFVSAMKLLVSFADTLAYLEFGDTAGNCKLWLSTYADLKLVGITPSEFWEFRNAILHTTNPFSRKVLSGSTTSLCFYSDPVNRQVFEAEKENMRMFSFEALYDAIIQAIDRWAATYSGNFKKQLEFIRRYDEILSEGRLDKLILTVREKNKSRQHSA